MKESITLEALLKLIDKEPNKTWPYDLFSITCKKCNSNNIEYNGATETEGGYYGDYTTQGHIIIKCHDCGNATILSAPEEYGSGSSYCPNCD